MQMYSLRFFSLLSGIKKIFSDSKFTCYFFVFCIPRNLFIVALAHSISLSQISVWVCIRRQDRCRKMFNISYLLSVALFIAIYIKHMKLLSSFRLVVESEMSFQIQTSKQIVLRWVGNSESNGVITWKLWEKS